MSETDVLPEPGPTRPKRRRRLHGCGVLLLVLFAFFGAFYAFLGYTNDRETREVMAEIDRQEPEGWKLADLEAHRKTFSDEENAALVAQAVKAKLPVNWGATRAAAGAPATASTLAADLEDLPPPMRLDLALREDLQAALVEEGVQQALTEANKLAGLRDGRYSLTWSTDVISTVVNSHDALSAAYLLQLQAIRLAEEGEVDAALAATRGILVAGRSVGDEPLMVSQYIRMACTTIALHTLERVLAQGEPSPRELKTMQELLEAEAAEPLLQYAARGERASMHQLMSGLKSRDIAPSAIGGSQGFQAAFHLAGPTLARGSHARMLRLLNEQVAVARLPPEQQAEPARALEKKVKEAKANYDVLIGLLMPAFQRMSEAYRRDQAWLRCAIAAVAAERHRRDRGTWPATLEALVPDYLRAVPIDPYDAQPLRYKRLADGVIVYSIGPDKVDNGGACNRANYMAKGTDYPFRLWDVDRRRQPPAELLPLPDEGN